LRVSQTHEARLLSLAAEPDSADLDPPDLDRPDLTDRPVVLHPRPPQALRRHRGRPAASAEIHEGETYGLLGPNGAGKTTTISMICGLLARDSGEVTLDGTAIDIGEVAAKAGIGYVPRRLAVYPVLTGRGDLDFGRLYGIGGEDLKERVAGVLADRPRRARRRPGRDLQRRHAAAAQHRRRTAPPAAPGCSTSRPWASTPRPQRNPQIGRRARPRGHGDPVHDALPRGRAAVRPRGIIDAGEIRAEGTTRDLVASIGQRDRVRLSVGGEVVAAAAVRQVEGVTDVGVRGDELEILVTDARGLLIRLLNAAEGAGAVIRGVEVIEPDLEAVFLHLTGRALRDSAE
jgi:ABC-2 type transport system ATP-binding protein